MTRPKSNLGIQQGALLGLKGLIREPIGPKKKGHEGLLCALDDSECLSFRVGFMGLRVYRVQGLGFRVSGVGFRVFCSCFRFRSPRFVLRT